MARTSFIPRAYLRFVEGFGKASARGIKLGNNKVFAPIFMMNVKDLSGKLKQVVQKLNVLGEYCYRRVFSVFVILTVVIFATAGLIFYHYAVVERSPGLSGKDNEVRIDQSLYREVILRLDNKKIFFSEDVQIDQSLSDPFK